MSAPETCKRGHPWTPENTGLTGGGRRFCRECSRARSRAARARLTGQPCMGCGRTGLTLDGGRHCSRCLKRKSQGRPLDGPAVRAPRAAKPVPEPVVAPKRPAKSKLPKTWYDPAPKKTQGKKRADGAVVQDTLYLGPLIPTSPEISAACLALLQRHDCLDLATMLGVADEEPTGATPPKVADVTPAVRRPRGDGGASLIADVRELLHHGECGDVIATRLGYTRLQSLEARLRRLGQRELANRVISSQSRIIHGRQPNQTTGRAVAS